MEKTLLEEAKSFRLEDILGANEKKNQHLNPIHEAPVLARELYHHPSAL